MQSESLLSTQYDKEKALKEHAILCRTTLGQSDQYQALRRLVRTLFYRVTPSEEHASVRPPQLK